MEPSAVWQIIAATAAVAAVWFAARHDSRQTRAAAQTEFQQAIKDAIDPRLAQLDSSITAVATGLGHVEARLNEAKSGLDRLQTKLDGVEASLTDIKIDVAHLRGQHAERGRADLVALVGKAAHPGEGAWY